MKVMMIFDQTQAGLEEKKVLIYLWAEKQWELVLVKCLLDSWINKEGKSSLLYIVETVLFS